MYTNTVPIPPNTTFKHTTRDANDTKESSTDIAFDKHGMTITFPNGECLVIDHASGEHVIFFFKEDDHDGQELTRVKA